MNIADNWKKVVAWGLVVIVVLLILIGLLVGLKGLKDFFKWLVIGLLVLCILFAAGYVFYILFIKVHYKDIPAQYRKKLQSITKVMRNKMLNNLYLSGDMKHNRINLGKYFYLRILLPKITKAVDDPAYAERLRAEGKNPEKEVKTEPVPIDCFIVQKKGWLDRIFSDPLLILVKPQDHDYSAIFNDVTIRGFNLVPLDSQFYTIDTRNLDLEIIRGLTLNYQREVIYEVFKELDRMVKQSINLDQRFEKDKERAREFEIPLIGQQQGGK